MCLSEEQGEEKCREDDMSALVHFVDTMSQWSEKKTITMLHSCGEERGGNQPGDKGAERIPPALSISTACPGLNTTGCSPELHYGANPAWC